MKSRISIGPVFLQSDTLFLLVTEHGGYLLIEFTIHEL